MVPPGSRRSTDNESYYINWNTIGRAVVGLLIAWAAWEFRQMREAIYSVTAKNNVLETRVGYVEQKQQKHEDRIEKLESRLMEGTK